ncbi:helix-turn-helix transcriptional regulator [Lentzea sp. CA-135723]|uniref:helix-turn-helix transcriptional regulator n=1 Tax=Lentzea sp. CA-135723 TaxID=3239950 RepID=UPI003D8A7E7C
MELVGREEDIERVRAFVDSASTQGGALLLSGEAGIGKTELLEFAAAHARQRGTLVLRATGSQFEAGLSFAGLHQVLYPLVKKLDALPKTQARALRAAIGLSDERADEPIVIAHAAFSLLLETAESGPVLVIVDDLSWLDRPSAGALGFVARRLRGSRVGFLAASRVDEASFFDQDDLPAYVLSPLADDAAEELLRHRFPAMAASVRRRLRNEARGNPLALLELPVALTGEQQTAEAELPEVLPITGRLQRLFADRVRKLPDATRVLLLIAALDRIGDPARFLGAFGPGGLEHLGPAERVGLIRVDRGRLTFRHPLTRSAVVDISTAQERRQAHQTLADQLVDRPELRAWHLAEATLGPDEEVAKLLEWAAHQSLNRGDSTGAVAGLTRSAELGANGPDRARRLAMAAYLGSNVTGHLRHVPRLLAAARVADPTASGSMEITVAAAHLLLNGDGDLDTAHRLLSSSIDMLPRPYNATDPALIEALHTLLLLCFFGGRPALWSFFDAALTHLAPEVPPLLALQRDTFRDPVRTGASALARLDAAITDLPGENDPVRIVRTGLAASYLDRLGGCRPALRRVVRDGRSGGAVTAAIQALFLLANHAYLTGEWDEALELCQEGLELSRTNDYRLLSWPGTFIQAMIAACRGETDNAHALADQMERWAAPRRVGAVQAYAAHVRTMAALADGDHPAALHHVGFVSPPGALASHVPHALWTVLDLTDAALRRGRREVAASHVSAAGELVGLSPRLAMITAGARAMAASSFEPALFDAALSVEGAALWQFDRARIQLAYGEQLRRAKAQADARRQLTEALETFEQLGAEPWAARARHELRTGTGKGGTLSPQQREIAELAASGLTNKEIGARLFLSSRTISTHLYQIFPKLGVSSRAALRDALSAQPHDQER